MEQNKLLKRIIENADTILGIANLMNLGDITNLCQDIISLDEWIQNGNPLPENWLNDKT